MNPPHIFAARIAQINTGVVTHIVPIPPEIGEEYVEEGARRVIALLNGAEVRRYLFQTKDGEYAIMVGKSVIRDLQLPTEEPMIVELCPDPDPDRVELCPELVAVLELDESASERFYGMTPGKQRSFALHVCGGKRPATRERRALELARKLRTFTLYSDGGPGEDE